MVFDSQGGETLERSFSVVKPGGTVVTVGGTPDAKFARAWGVNPVTSTPHLRQDKSLLGVMPLMPPAEDQLDHERAEAIFKDILTHCDRTLSKSEIRIKQRTGDYNRISLLRLTCEHAPSKNAFLTAFFEWLASGSSVEDAISSLANFDDLDVQQKDEAVLKVTKFADYLVDNFFLPRKITSLIDKSNADYL